MRVNNRGEDHGVRDAGWVHGVRYPRLVGKLGCVEGLFVGGEGEPEYVGAGIRALRLKRLDPVKLFAVLAGGTFLESYLERRAV